MDLSAPYFVLKFFWICSSIYIYMILYICPNNAKSLYKKSEDLDKHKFYSNQFIGKIIWNKCVCSRNTMLLELELYASIHKKDFKLICNRYFSVFKERTIKHRFNILQSFKIQLSFWECLFDVDNFLTDFFSTISINNKLLFIIYWHIYQ